jgi:hypothetical protein
MPATGDRIAERKDGLFQGMYTAQTPDGPKRKYIYGRKKKDVERRVQPHQQLEWKLAKPSLGLHECLDGSSIPALDLLRHRNAAKERHLQHRLECGPCHRGPSGSGQGDPAPLSPRSFLYSRRHSGFSIRGDERE